MVRLLKHEGKDRYKFQKQNLKYIANWVRAIVLQFYFCMIPWSGFDPMIKFMIILWSYDLVLGACHDPMICRLRFQWSKAKKLMIPWLWSQVMSCSHDFDLENLVIRLFQIKNFRDPVILISPISMISQFFVFGPCSWNCTQNRFLGPCT